jgi:hypothetical protein
MHERLCVASLFTGSIMAILQEKKTVPSGGTIVSLLSFHRSLIVTAIAFCLLYAGWELRAWLGTGGIGLPIMAGLFALLGIGLAVYLARLATILKLEE